MELTQHLHSEIDTSRSVPSVGTDGEGAVFIKEEIGRVQKAIDDVGQALQELPAPEITTLPLAQLVIRNGTEIGMMSEGDLLQEIANVTAGIIRCDELLSDDAQPGLTLNDSLSSLAQELQIISARDASPDDDHIYCLCKLPYSATRSMIQCDFCDNWYHLICIGLSLLQLPSTYQCPACHAATTRKRRRHSHPMDVPENVIQPDVDLKLCQKGIIWLEEEIAKIESELMGVSDSLDGVSSELAAVERNVRNRAARASRKAAKAAITEQSEMVLHEEGIEDTTSTAGHQKTQRKRRRRSQNL